MSHARLLRFDVKDPVHGEVPCAALLPDRPRAALDVCLFLYGGGGSRESLAELQAFIESLWAQHGLTPICMATPDVGPLSFYLDDPQRGYAWESFITERFIPSVYTLCGAQEPGRPGLVGLSMGGYGVLKLAFARPQHYRAVAAVSPMIEPYTEADRVPLRNRFFYPPDVPQALLGDERDAGLYRADHPTQRAHDNAEALRTEELAIYVDAAGRDALNAHDGAESLHRALWDLDVPHEYHLRRDADHGGPDLLERLGVALRWVMGHLQPPAAAPLTPLEQAWLAWLDGTRPAAPDAPLTPGSPLFPRWLRSSVQTQRAEAERQDPSLLRRYGRL